MLCAVVCCLSCGCSSSFVSILLGLIFILRNLTYFHHNSLLNKTMIRFSRSMGSLSGPRLLFGRQMGNVSCVDDFKEEKIVIKNSQRKFPIDIDLTRKHIKKILEILQIPDFSVFLLFCSDAKMREINKNLRQKSKSTDILSYALPDGAFDPLSGVKEGPSYLGTFVICPAFVSRQMLADQEAYEHDDLDLSEDGGVSKAMATVFSVQRRLPFLLAHGAIHLMGYDHETDEQWARMTQKEDEVLQALAEAFPDL